MGNILKLTSPICPSVNHYLGWRGIIKGGKPMAVSYKKPEAVKYQKNFSEYVKKEAKNKVGLNLIINHNIITWTVFFILIE